MKAKTIGAIRGMLEQKVKAAQMNLNNIEFNLVDKYGTEYNMNISVTHSEKAMYQNAVQEVNDYKDFLDDFEKHNW